MLAIIMSDGVTPEWRSFVVDPDDIGADGVDCSGYAVAALSGTAPDDNVYENDFNLTQPELYQTKLEDFF